MKAILSLLAAVSITATLQAQTTNSTALGSKTGSAGATTSTTQISSQSLDDNGREVVSLGVGFGFDYSGIGVGAIFYPQKNIGVFANGGIFAAGPSYTVGVKGRYVTNSKVDPYLTVAYGYSGSVAVTDEDDHIDESKSKIFYRMNIGFGADFHFTNTFCLSAGLTTNRAVRAIEDYREELENKGYDFGNSFILPVGFSVGLKWRIR